MSPFDELRVTATISSERQCEFLAKNIVRPSTGSG